MRELHIHMKDNGIKDSLRKLAHATYRDFLAPGRFAQKPVPPGTVRAKNIFRTGRFLPGRFAHFSKK